MADSDREQDELLQRFRDGDHEAFRLLTEPHLPVLEARARRRIGARLRKKVSAADIVQEARLVAFRRRADFEAHEPDSLRRWLLAIVDNRARKVIEHHAGTDRRDLARELTRGARPPTVALPGRGRSPSQVAATRELAELTRRARSMLGSDDRELLRLAHDERLPLREVAERLGRSYQAVKKAHARTLVRLGESLRRLRRNDHDSRE